MADTRDPFVYLSYAREDEQEVQRILQALREKGFEVFIDVEMPGGVRWESVLETRLKDAYAVMVVWSKHSLKSPWVEKEADAGLAKDRLFPVRLDRDVEPPPRFAHINAVDLTGWNGTAADPKFDRAIRVLQPMWEAQNGVLKAVTLMRPARLQRRIRTSSTEQPD